MTTLDHALTYLASGYSVIPVRTDGTKAPAVPWKAYMEAPPDTAQAERWWPLDDPPGVALVCGAVSGCLEVIDFDREAEATFAAWRLLIEEGWPGLLGRVSVVRTPLGYHVWLRCGNVETPGNTKLAQVSDAERAAEKALALAEGRKPVYTLIETRGQGGYALAPGCPGCCHPSGGIYLHLEGAPLEALPDLSIDERDFLLACARSFDRALAAPEPVPRSAPGNDLRPGDDFDRHGWDWGELLGKYRWELAGQSGAERRWRRPGKGRGWSATTGHCTGADGSDLLRVFSSNAEPFAEGQSYGKFRAFALLETGGDLSAAARQLKHLGYGSAGFLGGAKVLDDPQSRPGDQARPEKPPAPFPLPIPASMLKAGDPALSWIWNGFLRRGEVTLLAALWKAGKTTLLAHLLRALGAGGEFLGRELLPARVLYVTEESEARWAARRDAVGLDDHVHFLVRPFATKPRHERWEEFLHHVGGLIESNGYDVVVMDTLANLWPVRDENDASAVQAALMPLHSMIDKVALQLVHHTRKSDGSEATASRGSGALTGFVDTIVEFRRYLPGERGDRRRVLSGYGRHDETPQELVIELTDGGYVAHGDRESIQCRELGDVIATILPPRRPGLNADQILEAWPEDTRPNRNRFFAALKAGVDSGAWQRSGAGKKGSPYLFWLLPDESDASPFDNNT